MKSLNLSIIKYKMIIVVLILGAGAIFHSKILIAAESARDVEVGEIGETTLLSSEIDVPFRLKNRTNGDYAGIMRLGCDLRSRQLSIVFSLTKAYTIFDGRKNGDQTFFSIGKDFSPSVYMKITNRETFNFAHMIGAARTVGLEDQANGWNDYYSIAIAMDIIADNKKFSIFTSGEGHSSAIINIKSPENEELDRQVHKMYKTISSVCKGAFNINF